MSKPTDIERVSQNRVVKLFKEEYPDHEMFKDFENNQPKELVRIAEFFCYLRGLEPSKTADIIRVNTIEAIPKLGELCT